MLWNNLTTEAVRAEELPIPVSYATATVNARKVDLGPWVPEFEMILASTRVRLPFHVRMPDNFATRSDEIRTYEANYRWSGDCFVTSLFSPFDHVAMLVFWRSNSFMYPKDVSQSIADCVGERGRATPTNGLVVVNCLEGLNEGTVRWKLAKNRAEKMKREGDWKMAVYRSDVRFVGEPTMFPSFSAVWVNDVPDTNVFLQLVMKSPRRNGEKSANTLL